MTKYCSSECNKPDNKKLVWIVSKKTAQNLKAGHFSVPGLPTIPEGSWAESERLIDQFFCFFHAVFCLIEYAVQFVMRYWQNACIWIAKDKFFSMLELSNSWLQNVTEKELKKNLNDKNVYWKWSSYQPET